MTDLTGDESRRREDGWIKMDGGEEVKLDCSSEPGGGEERAFTCEVRSSSSTLTAAAAAAAAAAALLQLLRHFVLLSHTHICSLAPSLTHLLTHALSVAVTFNPPPPLHALSLSPHCFPSVDTSFPLFICSRLDIPLFAQAFPLSVSASHDVS